MLRIVSVALLATACASSACPEPTTESAGAEAGPAAPLAELTMGHASGQFRQVDDTPRLIELAAPFQLLAHRQLIDGIVAFVEGDHRCVYTSVGAMVERLFVEQFDGPPHGASVDQQGAEDGLLHLHRLRRQTILRGTVNPSSRWHVGGRRTTLRAKRGGAGRIFPSSR